jgi:hypothetical protein
VPAEQTTDGRGKGSYLLALMMTPLNHLIEALSACGPDDANIAAFIEVTSIIKSCDAMEEFLTCGLWPLSEKFGFEVEMNETPMSKVVVPMPQVTAVIGVQERGVEFKARIVSVTNLLVGNYNITEHNTCQWFWHG